MFQEIVQNSQFLFDEIGNFMCNDTGRIIVGKHLRFLVAILNSSLFFYAVKHFYGGGLLGENGVRMKHTFFQFFPCIKPNDKIEELSNELRQAYDNFKYQELDQIILNKYGLTPEECAEVMAIY